MHSVLRATLFTLSTTVLCAPLFASPLPQAEMARQVDRFNQRMQLGQPYDAATQQFLHSAASLSSAIFLRQAAEATPYFVNWMSGTRKVAGDNPWTTYNSALFDSRSDYVISGNVGAADYVGFQVYAMRDGRNVARAQQNRSTKDMPIDRQGNFSLRLTPTTPPPGQEAIVTTPDDYMVIVREYYHSGQQKVQRPARYRIRRLTGHPAPPIADAPHRSALAASFYRSLVLSSLDLSAKMSRVRNSSQEVEVDRSLSDALYPTTDNRYDGFYAALPHDDSVIRISGTLPRDATYISVVFYTPYYITPDYRVAKTYLTGQEIVRQADGRYQIHLSRQPRDLSNNLTSAGYDQGIVVIRYLGSQQYPEFDVQLLPHGSDARP
ncbi:hypothetical protein ETAE_1401 [Edwardsiella piscicida]|uniref:Uncharacterized protein n=3 Tax=Edwardsiella TaxID=635 RepID=A0A0H3DTX2_EDWTF|nr:DUF1214 domain-containing protein [Edwardsiella piscicida]ACY84242.1 hypothetical protein ETAE_1401 [Edwardsiella tarda EIB202]ADM41409.1 hypothetical protein ETAF_1297 [Edwardsiella tarda FL6-60]MDM3865410.1 DUF1214 domain-containing protein [Edwardsiella piscicida]QHR93911.1 DUF1214 domain-containing protein [Edwardsiella piscicida]UJT83789.1 DUF1214 domain-containing protein [Edwardsiella piscicida]